MKLLRYGEQGAEKPGCLDSEGRIRDLSGHIRDLDGPNLSPESLEELQGIEVDALPVITSDPRIGPCIARPGKIVCIGLNFRDHAEEAGMAAPSEPIIFLKASSSFSGPYDPILLPKGSEKTDWEAELGVVIGSRASYVEEEEALDFVAGYCLVNDISERAFQIESTGQWTKGKSADSFAPVGPYLVTKTDLADPQAQNLWSSVNGERQQDGTTANMIFPVKHLIAYVSRYMTLEPGDLIATGTPYGVGMGFSPPRYLKAGDEMRIGGDGLGEQIQEVVAHSS